MSELMRAMLDAAMPDGAIWRPAPDSDLDNLLDGTAENLETVRLFLAGIKDARNPALTDYLADLEREFGVLTNLSLTDAQRRDQLHPLVYGRGGGGTIDDMQTALDNAGFDVIVYENDPAVDPAIFLNQDFQMVAGGGNAFAGNAGAFAGRTGGELLVNGDIFQMSRIFTSVAGTLYAGTGHGAGEYVDLLRSKIEYPIPADPGDWPLVFFVGGRAVRAGGSNFAHNPGDDLDVSFPVVGSFAYDVGHNLVTSAQDTSPSEGVVSASGAKMIVGGLANKKIYAYTLSTLFDTSTGTHDAGKDLDVSAYGFPYGVAISPDGTHLYVAVRPTALIHHFILGTAFEPNSGVYQAGHDINLAGTDEPNGLVVSADGTHIYMAGGFTKKVFSFTMSTPFNSSTATYNAGHDLDTASETTAGGLSLWINPVGNKLYATAASNQKVFLYTLSTPLNLSTATYDGAPSDISTPEATNTRGLTLSPDETHLYLTDAVVQAILSWTVAIIVDSPQGVALSNDGLHAYTVENQSGNVREFALLPANDLGSAVHQSANDFDISAIDNDPQGITISNDGTRLLIVGKQNLKVYSFTLAIPWNLGSISQDAGAFEIDVSSQDTSPSDVFISGDGLHVYVSGITNASVYHWGLSSENDTSTAAYVVGGDLDVSTLDATPSGLTMREDGSKLYVSGRTNGKVYSITVEPEFITGSALYDGSTLDVDVTAQDTLPQGLALSGDELTLLMVGDLNDSVYSYSATPGTGGLLDIDQAQVPLEQEQAFKRIILGIKPAHSWAALIIDFS